MKCTQVADSVFCPLRIMPGDCVISAVIWPNAMLNLAQLKAIPVCELALQLFPESVARENCVLPIAVNCDTLHLIIPSDYRSIAIAGQPLLDMLQFILERELTYELADRTDLLSFVDLHYKAAYSKITNCDRRFSINCPKLWADLQTTQNVLVLLCNVCRKDVYFCSTEDELEAHSKLNHCVAFYDSVLGSEMLGLPYNDDIE